jgi:hypothetical protein
MDDGQVRDQAGWGIYFGAELHCAVGERGVGILHQLIAIHVGVASPFLAWSMLTHVGKNLPQWLKPGLFMDPSARLKSCPFKAHTDRNQ